MGRERGREGRKATTTTRLGSVPSKRRCFVILSVDWTRLRGRSQCLPFLPLSLSLSLWKGKEKKGARGNHAVSTLDPRSVHDGNAAAVARNLEPRQKSSSLRRRGREGEKGGSA